jgi:5-methylthioadenosine/S-adenosylhomocysteine deaminase
MTIAIRNCDYLIRSPEKVERGSNLLIEGSRIRFIGKDVKIPTGTEIIDGSNCVVMPGLINPHTHLYQNMIKGIAPGLALVPWCNEVLFPTVGAIRKVTGEAKQRIPYLWSALGAMEMIRGGVTCCVNMDVTSPEVMQAWLDLGFRGVMAYTLSNKWVPADLRSTEVEMKRKVLQFVDEYHHPDGLTTVFMAPSTLFLCTNDFIRWIVGQAKEKDLGIQIHIAETSGEVDDLLKETGRRTVQQLKYLGMLESRLSAVHCVHINQEEIASLADAAVKVVHCPKSNMKLADGAAPVARMRSAGISVSIATDGCASNDLLDMWEEMRAAVMLARVSENNASALSPRDAFRMATIEAAQAARVEAGELEPGKLADVAIVELKANHLQPFHDEDIFNFLVFCGKASDVRDTIIHGEVVMRDRQIKRVHEENLLAEASSYAKTLYDLRAGYSAD